MKYDVIGKWYPVQCGQFNGKIATANCVYSESDDSNWDEFGNGDPEDRLVIRGANKEFSTEEIEAVAKMADYLEMPCKRDSLVQACHHKRTCCCYLNAPSDIRIRRYFVIDGDVIDVSRQEFWLNGTPKEEQPVTELQRLFLRGTG